jgi:hypothetical protein
MIFATKKQEALSKESASIDVSYVIFSYFFSKYTRLFLFLLKDRGKDFCNPTGLFSAVSSLALHPLLQAGKAELQSLGLAAACLLVGIHLHGGGKAANGGIGVILRGDLAPSHLLRIFIMEHGIKLSLGIRPKQIMGYTIARDTPCKTLQAVPAEEIARLQAELGY